MTANRRIFLNIIATYGRSLYALVCGLFTARWVLMALGKEAYGVYGVVAVIISIITLVNGMLSASVSRYYALSVGAASVAKDKFTALNECREWFTSAVLVHTVLPLVLITIGYPIGIWAIHNYFEIPTTLLNTSEWVFRFACLTAFVGMVNVPYSAMYHAKQYIAELTIYSFIITTLNFICAWYLVHYQGDALFLHALYTCLLAIVPQIIIAWRACVVFPECRILWKKIWNPSRLANLFSFAGWQCIGWCGSFIRTQGCAALVNRALGLEYNSTMSLSMTITSHSALLGNALTGAFQPALTNAVGANDRARTYTLMLMTSKFGTLLCAVFVIPLALEISYVLNLWLDAPPPMLAQLSIMMMCNLILDRFIGGFLTVILAYGRIMWHEIGNAAALIFSLIVGWVMIRIFHCGILTIGFVFIFSTVLIGILRAWLVWKHHGFSLNTWLFKLIIPFSVISMFSIGGGFCLQQWIEPSLIRVMATAIVCNVILGLGAYKFMLENSERMYLWSQIKIRFKLGK